MTILNSIFGGLFSLILGPFAGVHPMWGLTVVSLLTALAMLLVFKATSNQTKLDGVKRQIHACLFEIRLFNDDLRAILRAQGEILRHNARYLGLSLVPLLWMIVPFVLIVAQLQTYYGFAGPEPGDTMLVVARVRPAGDDAVGARPDARLEVGSGLAVETPAVWTPPLRELSWRVRVLDGGDHVVGVSLGDEHAEKLVRVGDRVARRSPLRVAAGAWCSLTDPERVLADETAVSLPCSLLHPVESPLPGEGRIESIRVSLDAGRVGVLGWRAHWLVVYIVLSLVFAVALRRRLGVVI